MNESKKNASCVSPQEANAAGTASNNITDTVPQNSTIVNSEEWQEIEALFLQLDPEGQECVIRFAELLCLDPEFNKSLEARFGESLKGCNFQEVEDFVAKWKGGAA